jgi:hypothetical protein
MKNPYEAYCKKNKLSSPSGFTPQQWSYFQAVLNTARVYFKQECGGIDVGFNQVQFTGPKIYNEVYVNVVEWYEDATSAKKLLRTEYKKYAILTKDFRLTPYCHQHCYLSLIPTPKELRRHKKRARRQGKRQAQQQYYEYWNDLQNDAIGFPRAKGEPRLPFRIPQHRYEYWKNLELELNYNQNLNQ